jgi:hypothetical protein
VRVVVILAWQRAEDEVTALRGYSSDYRKLRSEVDHLYHRIQQMQRDAEYGAQGAGGWCGWVGIDG